MSDFRQTARVLLFDQEHRLLLMKVDVPASVRDPQKPWLRSPFWVTLGGRIEEGEDALSAAAREVTEETGLAAVDIGPAVWQGEQWLEFDGRLIRLWETFIVARTTRTDLTSDGWTLAERDTILEMRWWTLADLRTTSETILPPLLPMLIDPIAEQRYGHGAIVIDLSARP